MNNIICQDIFGEVASKSLIPQQKKQTLPILLSFMLLKHNVTLNLREYTDSCQQRLWTNKEDVLLLIPSNEALKFTLLVDTQNGRDVAVVDLLA